MRIAFSNHEIFHSPSGWRIGELVGHPTISGKFAIMLDSHTQFSMQPDGAFGDRDVSKGEGNGEWEACTRAGNLLAFEVNGVPYGLLYMVL